MKIILKNARVINPIQKLDSKLDLLIEDGVIQKIGEISEKVVKDSQIFDFENKICVPGLFDMHVHLREPGREDEETIDTGSNSAAAGGFTGVACMPNTSPDIDSAEIVKFIKEKSKKNLVDVFPVAAATLNRKGEALSPIAELYEAGAIAFSDDGSVIKNAGILRRVLEYSKMFDVPVIEHCEDETLSDGAMNEGLVSTILGMPSIPNVAEDLIVARDILMAEFTDARIHIAHISTKGAVELIRQAKKRGVKVTAEVTPHHFTLTDDSLKLFDTNYKMSPPLRTTSDIQAILEGLKDGTIDCIASDHAPHAIEEKEMEFVFAPNGIVGLETTLGISISELVHKKILTLNQLIEKLSINPRKILNLPIPEIKEGSEVNLTIIDTDLIWTVDVTKLKSKSKNSPFDKRLLTGKSISVINKRQMYFEDNYIRI
ncbi:MAG: dihydroorotase [Ignavibacteria bacterium]|nr:dihydroorotase [Ignavibacteria bacterium]